MKRLRLIIRITSGILIALALIGITLLIVNDNPAVDTTYEIIAFSIGIAGMLMAVFSELDSARQEREVDRLLRQVNDSARNIDNIDHENDKVLRIVSESAELDRKIYAILTEHGIGEKRQRKQLATKIGNGVRRHVAEKGEKPHLAKTRQTK